MNGLFHVGRLRLLAIVAAASLVLSVALMLQGDPDDDVHSVQADTFSRSALGYAAWRALLEEADLRTLRDRSSGIIWDPWQSVVVIAEPERELPHGRGEMLLIDAFDQAANIVLVLPKRRGTSTGRNSWIESSALREQDDAQWILDALEIPLSVTRPGGAPIVLPTTTGDARPLEITVADPQLVNGTAIRAIAENDDGVLAGWVDVPDGLAAERSVLLVADPDLVANHGLHRADNATFALDLVQRHALGRPTAVVFDETIHAPLDEPSLFRRLTTFPLAVAFVQGLLALVVTVWAGMVRFGAALPPERRLGAGLRTLLDNTSELLVVGGHGGRALRRYWERTLREVATTFHAPADANEDELLAVATRASRSRSTRHVPAELADAVRHLTTQPGRRRETARATLHQARRIHRWRQEVLHGPTPDPRDR